MRKTLFLLVSLLLFISSKSYSQDVSILASEDNAKPAAIKYEINIIRESSFCYNIKVIVSSSGAKDLIVSCTDYSIGQELVEIFYGQDSAEYTYECLYYDSPVLIKFTARNDYGETTDSYYTNGISFTGISLPKKEAEVVSKEIYSALTGKLIAKLKLDESINTTNIASGFYIIKSTYTDGSTSSEKVCKTD